MTRPYSVLSRLRYRVRSRISRIVSVYWLWAFAFRRRNVVHRRTGVVIEGFPRSGNTFAGRAFRFAQHNSVSVASHLHTPMQVILGAKWNIPIILVIREPMSAVTSHVIYQEHLTVEQSLLEYIYFYESLIHLKEKVVVAPFEETTRNFGEIIGRVNEKYGTNFNRFDHTEENVKKCFDGMEESMKARGIYSERKVGRPSSERTELRNELANQFNSAELEPLLSRANSCYQYFMNDRV